MNTDVGTQIEVEGEPLATSLKCALVKKKSQDIYEVDYQIKQVKCFVITHAVGKRVYTYTFKTNIRPQS